MSAIITSGIFNIIIQRSYCGSIHVDINGPEKGPNVLGKDIFEFVFTKYNIIPQGSAGATGNYSLSSCRTQGIGCTAWVLTRGNMDCLRKNVSW